MHVTVIPGVGPATAERLRRAGITTVADLEGVSEDELVRLLGKAHGHGLFLLARAEDDRPVVPERETKSVSVEGTYDTDLTDPRLMEGLVDPAGGQRRRAAAQERPVRAHDHAQGAAARLHHPLPLDHPRPRPPTPARSIARLARRLLAELDTTGGVRLLGVGVSGLADWIQEDLFGDDRPGGAPTGARRACADLPDATCLGARDGRRARRARARLGVGRRARHRDGAVRDRRDAARAGALAAPPTTRPWLPGTPPAPSRPELPPAP